jgi:hypothetical protein
LTRKRLRRVAPHAVSPYHRPVYDFGIEYSNQVRDVVIEAVGGRVVRFVAPPEAQLVNSDDSVRRQFFRVPIFNPILACLQEPVNE